MNLTVARPETDRRDRSESGRTTDRRRIDVSDLDASAVAKFVRSNVGTDRVCLEHRGGQTFLLVEE